MTLVVTGSGRSGTHWLAHVLGHFIEASHEPTEIAGDVVVDCRQAQHLPEIAESQRCMQLIRDGRDVCRSQFTAYAGRRPWATICRDWARIVAACDDAGLRTVRLEDLLLRQDPSKAHIMPAHPEWSAETKATFWAECGEVMARHGYAV